MIIAYFVRTVLGWYNVTINDVKYNVAPEVFRSIAGVSDKASYGCAELTADDVKMLIDEAIAL